jgi:hypothetical protein
LVKWSWHLGTGWERTKFQGLVVDAFKTGTGYRANSVRVLVVLCDDGLVLDVRDDEGDLEMAV